MNSSTSYEYQKSNGPDGSVMLKFTVTPAVMKALRLIAKDSGEDIDRPPQESVMAFMAPVIAAELLEAAVIDVMRERYDKTLGEL